MAVKSKTEGTTTNLGNEQYSATDAEAELQRYVDLTFMSVST